MIDRRVSPNDRTITEADYRALVARGVGRVAATTGCDRLGLRVGCNGKTLRHARDGKSTLEGATLFNLLTVDVTALDELAAHFGMRLVPIEVEEGQGARLLADSAGLTATLADAMADGVIDHREEQVIASKARVLIPELSAIVAAADRKRV